MTECHIPDDLYLLHANFFTTLNFKKWDNRQAVSATEMGQQAISERN
jgi:hypothetical protein